jgi:hypothetical protein
VHQLWLLLKLLAMPGCHRPVNEFVGSDKSTRRPTIKFVLLSTIISMVQSKRGYGRVTNVTIFLPFALERRCFTQRINFEAKTTDMMTARRFARAASNTLR